jgi:hypothetical protein
VTVPRHKSLLVPVTLVRAGRLRKCYHDPRHQIRKGDACLEVKENLSAKGYCLACADRMQVEAARRLAELAAEISRSVPEPNALLR